MSIEHLVYPWDTPDLPPRDLFSRCARHPISKRRDRAGGRGGGCAFRDDDPARCPRCHRSWSSITARMAQIGHECDQLRDRARVGARARRNAG